MKKALGPLGWMADTPDPQRNIAIGTLLGTAYLGYGPGMMGAGMVGGAGAGGAGGLGGLGAAGAAGAAAGASSEGTVLFPRGVGASTGAMPDGYQMVSRWVSPQEASGWIENGGTVIPGGIGAGNRVYVTELGAPQPGGTGPIRIDFGIPTGAVNPAGNTQWGQIFQPAQNIPIYNVQINVPAGTKIP